MGCMQSTRKPVKATPPTLPKPITQCSTFNELYQRIQQIGFFKCKTTSLLTLHNYIVQAREKKDVQNLLIFDCSEATDAVKVSDVQITDDAKSELGLYRAQMLDLGQIDVAKFKQQIYFKHVFLVGLSNERLESQQMLAFLSSLVTEMMRPFSVYLVKNCTTVSQIHEQGFKHLCLGDRKLPLFPNIMLRSKDFKQNTKERVLLVSSQIKRQQLNDLNVNTVVLMESELPIILDCKGLSVAKIQMDKAEQLCSEQKYQQAYSDVKSQLMPLLQKNKQTLCIVTSQPDNMPVVLIAEYFMTKSGVSKEKALEVMKQRRLQAEWQSQFADCIGVSSPIKKAVKQVVELTRQEQMTQCFLQLKGDKQACFEMLDSMLKKIVDTDDAKFRSVKQQNKRIVQVVTRRKEGRVLMGLVGFVEGETGGEKTWLNQGSISYVKTVRLELALGYKEAEND